jgi:hypothetical protein
MHNSGFVWSVWKITSRPTRRISQPRNQNESKQQADPCFHAGFLLDLFFDLEDGGDMLLRNVCRLSTDYMVLYPRRQNTTGYIVSTAKNIWFDGGK